MKVLPAEERAERDDPVAASPVPSLTLKKGSDPFLRRSEIVLLGYFVYAAMAGFVLPVSPQVATFTALVNLTLITAYVLLGYVDAKKSGDSQPHSRDDADSRRVPSGAGDSSRFLRASLPVLRDWAPVALVLLAYREMGWFAPAGHTYELEQSWIVWDRLLLNDWGFQAGIERFGALLPAILEISYALVYAVGPFSMAALYSYGRRASANRFLFTYLLGTLISYSLFPFFPSEPPRAVFPGENAALDNVFRQFNWWLLGGHGIHTSVFPSAHVSSAFAAAFGLWRVMPERRWPGRLMFVLACLIFTATVYGRYHYLVDGLAGIAVALTALGITNWVERRTK